mgnify:FL=1
MVTRLLVRTETAEWTSQIFSRRGDETAKELGRIVTRHVENTPLPSTGKPMSFDSPIKAPLTMVPIRVEATQANRELYEIPEGDTAATIALMTLGLVMAEEYDEDDVAFVMDSLADEPEMSKYHGVGWKYFDPRTDIPQD